MPLSPNADGPDTTPQPPRPYLTYTQADVAPCLTRGLAVLGPSRRRIDCRGPSRLFHADLIPNVGPEKKAKPRIKHGATGKEYESADGLVGVRFSPELRRSGLSGHDAIADNRNAGKLFVWHSPMTARRSGDAW